MEAAGVVVADNIRLPLQVDGGFESLDSIRAIGIRSNDRTFHLGDIA